MNDEEMTRDVKELMMKLAKNIELVVDGAMEEGMHENAEIRFTEPRTIHQVVLNHAPTAVELAEVVI